MKSWHCKKHNTFGDEGYSCAICGYPLGAKNLELVNGKIIILKRIVNLFFIKLYFFDRFKLIGE